MRTEAEILAASAEGPALIGIFINLVLYGVMVTQIAFYFTAYPTDPLWIKVYVAILFVTDTLNSSFNMAWIYGVLITNFGNIDALGVGNWLFESDQALTGIISMQVQLFYAWRIYKITGRPWVAILVCLLSIVGGLCGIGTAIGIGITPVYAGMDRLRLKIVVVLWLIGSATCDVLITSTLTWYLRKHRTLHARTHGIVTRITQLIVSNGFLTTACALADATTYLAANNSYHLAFNFPLCKLYGNTVMSTLNARSILNSNSASNITPQQQWPLRLGVLQGGAGYSQSSRNPLGGNAKALPAKVEESTTPPNHWSGNNVGVENKSTGL